MPGINEFYWWDASGGRLASARLSEFQPDGVLITDLGPDPETQRYSLDEVHEALIRYWRFILPGSGERRSALLAWARGYERENAGSQNPQRPCIAHLPL